MMLVYISGAITGTTDYKERFNKLSKHIYENTPDTPINPVQITKYLPEGTEWFKYMRACIKALCDCDKIYMMEGWEKSKGATEEHKIAKLLKLEIEYEDAKKMNLIGIIYEYLYELMHLSVEQINCVQNEDFRKASVIREFYEYKRERYMRKLERLKNL